MTINTTATGNTMNKHSILYTTLCRALSIKRPHATPAVDYFTQWMWDELPVHLQEYAHLDDCDNLHVDNRRNDPDARTLFVAHVDTVHRDTGPNKFTKTDKLWSAKDAPLGADDGAGCAMLMHLIHNDVPGYYVFTQGEECGGIGAKHLAKEHGDLLMQFDRAIAFDRRGIDSVITHQGYGRCCSDAFAQAVADSLNMDERMMYLPDDTGVYTDTAEFVDHIAECTNISIGYALEHSAQESLDILHFTALSEAVLSVQWDKLPTKRKAGEVEDMYNKGNWWQTYGDDSEEQWARTVVEDALVDAEFGMPEDLLMLAAESVYPEDPKFALKFMNKRKLTKKFIKLMQEQIKTYDADTVLCTIFDKLHIPQ